MTDPKSTPKARRRILMITPYVPQLSQSGGQRHSFYTVKYLSQTNDITIICFSRSAEGLEELKKYCRKVILVKRGKTWDIKKILRAGFGLYPFLLINYINHELRQAIESEITAEQYDLIHCDCLYPMPNIPKTNIPIVLVDVTIEYAIYQHYVQSLRGWRRLISPILWIDVLKLKYWETKYWRDTNTVVMFSPIDREFVAKVTGRKDIKVFEDGVDPQYFHLPPKTPRSSYPSILFGASNMKWMQNRESVELIILHYWPPIKQRYPEAKLYIIGRNAPEFFNRYASNDIIVAEADADGGPHDPQYYYELCWLLLAPMGSGGGTRNKFLEGMTFGLPVVTNPEGGMGNIKIENFKHSIVCPNHQIITNVFKLIDDPQYRLQMGSNARKLIQDNYAFDSSVKKLNDIYAQILKK
jgi:glycosyltransferase involved in cell wall biosynthesis